MSEQIDWSKAPADATHYQAEALGVFECWLKPGHAVRVSRGEPDWRQDDYADDLIATSAIERPWSGEGLPPVGVVCEVRNAPGGWGKATIKYQGKGVTVWLWDRPDGNTDQIEFASCPDRLEFRPIRTPEQIAADERELAVAEMLGLFGGTDSRDTYLMQRLYDAGYRKP